MANSWKASKGLPYEMKGYSNLVADLKKCQVRVEIDPLATTDLSSPSSDSFASNYHETMLYPDFLREMSSRAVGYTLRDTAVCLEKVLEKYIIYPEFYHHIAEFESVEMTQG